MPRPSMDRDSRLRSAPHAGGRERLRARPATPRPMGSPVDWIFCPVDWTIAPGVPSPTRVRASHAGLAVRRRRDKRDGTRRSVGFARPDPGGQEQEKFGLTIRSEVVNEERVSPLRNGGRRERRGGECCPSGWRPHDPQSRSGCLPRRPVRAQTPRGRTGRGQRRVRRCPALSGENELRGRRRRG